MAKIIDQVISETEARINKEIAECERIRRECLKPFPPHDDIAQYAKHVKDRCKGGKYSSEEMGKAIERKFALEEQLRDLANLKFQLKRRSS